MRGPPISKLGHSAIRRDCSCCITRFGLCCCRCNASEMDVPGPLAGSESTFTRAYGPDSLLIPFFALAPILTNGALAFFLRPDSLRHPFCTGGEIAVSPPFVVAMVTL